MVLNVKNGDNSEGCRGAGLLGSLEALGSLGCAKSN